MWFEISFIFFCFSLSSLFFFSPLFLNGEILWRSTDLCVGANVCFAGYSVDYKGALHCFPSGETVIRLLLLLWTGHHPAQCEICKSKGAGGKKECGMYF